MGLVLAENTQMLKLGKKLGFTVKRVEDSTEYELTIDRDNMQFE
jgi:acetyltransferase